MQLPANWQLPEEIKRRFGQKGAGKQRAMLGQGHLLLVLHRVPQPGSRQRQGIFFWRQPQGTWKCSEGGDGLPRLQKHLQDYSKAEQRLSQDYSKAEGAEDFFEILETLTPLCRAAKNMLDTLQAARQAVADDRDLIDLRDWVEDIDRILDLLYTDVKNALEFDLAKRAEEQTRLSLESVRTAQRLNLLAAVFLPLTALSSLFGMNLSNNLENSPIGFWLILGLGILLGTLTQRWILQASLKP
ncbi:MAG: hypothetical protein HC851_03655 [Acaryochloris sp. RU_4_1]|nr:hypothetical protein [Acaryochloris sp. RU_4_1]NJN38221.1 hypothetical protein [Acaryochloridaceae cyanobacterium CSU_3_4]